MLQIEDLKEFERFYQREYDYNTTALPAKDIYEIRTLAREKRSTYSKAPIGCEIFDLITSQNSLIKFEKVNFNSDRIDAILYILPENDGKAYIILNSNKPLVNQVFAAAHEYYHYIHDYEEIKDNPYVCDFHSLDSIMEKRACRFAAEFLLPSDVLSDEIASYEIRFEIKQKNFERKDYAALSVFLLIKYQMPLKSVFFRFHEEGYLKSVDKILEDYKLIKGMLTDLKIYEERIRPLFDNSNPYINNAPLELKQIQDTYIVGKATRDEILYDSQILGLDESMVRSIFDELEDDDEDLSDETKEKLKNLWEN